MVRRDRMVLQAERKQGLKIPDGDFRKTVNYQSLASLLVSLRSIGQGGEAAFRWISRNFSSSYAKPFEQSKLRPIIFLLLA